MTPQPLSLEHEQLLRPRLRHLDLPIAEYSFPNLYLFRATHNYQVWEGPEPMITGHTLDNKLYLMPTSDLRTWTGKLFNTARNLAPCLFPVPEQWLSSLDREQFDFHIHEGETDYLYAMDKLATYPGRKLHSKRNLVKQFLAHYHAETLPLTNERLPDALSVLEQWQAESGLEPTAGDYLQTKEALERYEALILCGAICYADGTAVGFAVGEEGGQGTFLLHFAKALKGYRGAYQYLFSRFAAVMPGDYCCMNLEQDLGLESLRQSKRSYQPDEMIKKFRVVFRSQ